jgi:hypothetical protein
VYLDFSEDPPGFSGLTVAKNGEQENETVGSYAVTLLTARPGTALVDTFAAQALMGQKAFEQFQSRLAAMGMRAITWASCRLE